MIYFFHVVLIWKKNILYGNLVFKGTKSVMEKRIDIDARKDKFSYFAREAYMRESSYVNKFSYSMFKRRKKIGKGKSSLETMKLRFKSRRELIKTIKSDNEIPF